MQSVLALSGLLAVLIILASWWGRQRHKALLQTVAEVRLPDVDSIHLGAARPIVVYLPPGYRGATAAYPVLYLNDGQEREALRLRETLARLHRRGRMRPIIAVAIPTTEERLHDYGTAIAPNAQGLGGRAAAYRDFILDELLPLIDARFRTSGENALLGASLGGLSAFDIAWNHPDRFATVGVFSGSFWWRASADEVNSPPGRRIAHAMVRTGRLQPGFRAWFQAGTRDEVADRDDNGVIDAIQDTTELIDELERLGYRRGRDVVYVEVVGGRHDWPTWAAVLPDFLEWAFGP